MERIITVAIVAVIMIITNFIITKTIEKRAIKEIEETTDKAIKEIEIKTQETIDEITRIKK